MFLIGQEARDRFTGQQVFHALIPVRFLLDENFPCLPDFLQALGSATAGIESLHSFPLDLSGTGTTDCYLYLRAAEAGADSGGCQL